MKIRSLLLSACGFLLPGICPAAPVLKGLWKFDDPGNPDRATVGTALTFQGAPPVYAASIADDGGGVQTGCITTAANVAANRIIAAHGINPLFPALRSDHRLFQRPRPKSKFLAAAEIFGGENRSFKGRAACDFSVLNRCEPPSAPRYFLS